MYTAPEQLQAVERRIPSQPCGRALRRLRAAIAEVAVQGMSRTAAQVAEQAAGVPERERAPERRQDRRPARRRRRLKVGKNEGPNDDVNYDAMGRVLNLALESIRHLSREEQLRVITGLVIMFKADLAIAHRSGALSHFRVLPDSVEYLKAKMTEQESTAPEWTLKGLER
jgi:hypothetical protein